MERLSPEMIKTIQHEQERRVQRIGLRNVVKAAKQSDNTEKLSLLAKVLSYLSLHL